ncbi:MAG: hypothetical protein MZV64_36955 [Ignavibacteriales bacterium]|nr:hypothetical protein [Ignavibacteriales bacterium]
MSHRLQKLTKIHWPDIEHLHLSHWKGLLGEIQAREGTGCRNERAGKKIAKVLQGKQGFGTGLYLVEDYQVTFRVDPFPGEKLELTQNPFRRLQIAGFRKRTLP